MAGTTKCELARKAWGNAFVVDDATDQKSTTKWSELYHSSVISINCKKLPKLS